MTLTKEAVAIAELVIYVPVLIAAILVVIRLGVRRQLGWIYLAVFCLIRLVGAGFEIDSHHHPEAKTPLEWSLILQSVGLSPLLLSSLGLLKRVIDETSDRIPSDSDGKFMSNGLISQLPVVRIIGKVYSKRATANSRRSRLIQILLLPCTIALVLCILGGTNETSQQVSDHATGKTEFKAGSIIFLVIYVFLFILTTTTFREWYKVPHEERRILVVVVLALPFIAVRLLYSILTVFSVSSDFSILGPNITIQLCMATVEEFVVVVIYTIVGFTVHNHLRPKNEPNGAVSRGSAYQYQGPPRGVH